MQLTASTILGLARDGDFRSIGVHQRRPDKVTPEAACVGLPNFFFPGFSSESSESSLLGKAQSLRYQQYRGDGQIEGDLQLRADE